MATGRAIALSDGAVGGGALAFRAYAGDASGLIGEALASPWFVDKAELYVLVGVIGLVATIILA